MTRFVAIDFETTGLNAERDRIVEFAFVEIDASLAEIARWTDRVNPGMPIPPRATEIHGITDADVAAKPPFARHAPRIQRLVADAILIAYNHEFDVKFLHAELARAGQPGLSLDHPSIDPLLIFQQHFPRHLAGAVRHYLGREHDGAHGALADVVATLDVLRAQREKHADLPRALEDNVARPNRTWLDFERTLYRDEAGIARFGIGKWKGERVADHLDFLEWMLAGGFSDETKRAARRLLDEMGAKK
ncbi:MAG: 3'-5' exonuclease [Thermoplasmatota archaeon]